MSNMSLFQCKITQDQSLSLSAFVSLEQTFEEFYQFIQKLPNNKQDINYKEVQSLLISKVFKTNIENNQNLQEIILPNLDLLTSLRIYQWLFNTNYMNLHVIDIINDKTHCFLNASNLKNMINNDLWPDILCFVLSEPYENCIVNHLESVLQKSDKEFWHLKSIITSNGFLYMSIVKKKGFWFLNKLLSDESKELQLGEAIIEALENGFKPISFFYFYEAKKIDVERKFLLKDPEIYADYYKKLGKKQEGKSKCCGEEKIAWAVMKALEKNEGRELRKVVKSGFSNDFYTENACLSREVLQNPYAAGGMTRSTPQVRSKKPQMLDLMKEDPLKRSGNAEIIGDRNIKTPKTHEDDMASPIFTANVIKTSVSGPKNLSDVRSPIWQEEEKRNYQRIPVQPMNICPKKSTQMVEKTKKPIEKDMKNMPSSAKMQNFPKPLDLVMISGAKTENCKAGFNEELPFGISKSEEQRKISTLIDKVEEGVQKMLIIPRQMSPPPLPKIDIPPRRD